MKIKHDRSFSRTIVRYESQPWRMLIPLWDDSDYYKHQQANKYGPAAKPVVP